MKKFGNILKNIFFCFGITTFVAMLTSVLTQLILGNGITFLIDIRILTSSFIGVCIYSITLFFLFPRSEEGLALLMKITVCTLIAIPVMYGFLVLSGLLKINATMFFVMLVAAVVFSVVCGLVKIYIKKLVIKKINEKLAKNADDKNE